MRRIAIAIVALCALGARPASADPADKARADKLFDDGRKYLANKEYQLACTAFEESERAEAAIGTALNIALCYEEWGHVAAAYRAFVEAERFAKLKFDDRAKVARAKIDALASKVPHLLVTIPASIDPSTVFLLDGKEIERGQLAGELVLETGPHVIEVRVPGQPPRITKIDLTAGAYKQVTLEVPKPELVVVVTQEPRKAGRLYGGIAAGVAGAAMIAIGGIVALHARDDYDAAVKTCPMLQCDTAAAAQKTNDARSRANEMTFVIAGGGVLVAAGAVLVLTSAGAKTESAKMARARTRVAPMIEPGAVGVVLGGGW